MADTFLQVRTNEADKIAASRILEELGTNTSAVVNMLLKQIILTKSIPFEVKLETEKEEKRICDFRKNDVRALLSKVTDSVEEVWVFGSTVTEFCRDDSDLDVCVVGHTSMKEESEMFKAPKCSVDLITETPEGFAVQSKISGSVYKEARDKGLLVYKKGVNIRWE